jgi:DNA topoisomerase-1
MKSGPYGLYLQKDLPHSVSDKSASDKQDKQKKAKKSSPMPKPQRVQVPKFINPQDMDLKTAIWLLQLPKVLGSHDNDDVLIGLGRFGPYVLYRGKYISIPKPEDILTITLVEAISLIQRKALSPRRQKTKTS